MMRYDNKGKAKMIIIIVLSFVILVGGMAVFVLKPGGAKKDAKEAKGPVSSLALGEFVVNLADPGEMRYLKTNVVLEVEGELASGGGHGEGAGADPKVRDAVIEVLSSKHFAELVKPDGKEILKKDIIASVNKRLEHAKVADVYFNDFAMQ